MLPVLCCCLLFGYRHRPHCPQPASAVTMFESAMTRPKAIVASRHLVTPCQCPCPEQIQSQDMLLQLLLNAQMPTFSIYVSPSCSRTVAHMATLLFTYIAYLITSCKTYHLQSVAFKKKNNNNHSLVSTVSFPGPLCSMWCLHHLSLRARIRTVTRLTSS